MEADTEVQGLKVVNNHNNGIDNKDLTTAEVTIGDMAIGIA
jgi:hypothetical protein